MAEGVAVPWSPTDLDGLSPADRFAQIVARCGDRVAVRGDGLTLTYEALDALAAQIAIASLDRSTRPLRCMGLLLEHGPLVAAAALGAAKAGCIWVQLHPDHPRDRSAFVLGDAEVDVLVSDPAQAERARALAAAALRPVSVVVVDETVPRGRRSASFPPAHPDDPVCIKYTSGSTGRPKGVCLPARAILHASMVYAHELALRLDDRVSALSAGIGATELYVPLLNGAALLPFDVRRGGIEALARWIAVERITCLRTIPTVLRRLGQAVEDGSRFEHVRIVRLFGEPVTRGDWEVFRALTRPSAELLVGLGSSEALAVRSGRFGWDASPASGVLPLDHEVPGKVVTVCDEGGAPVGVGEIGEIVVRSPFIFSGYWRQPSLTAAVLAVDRDDPSHRIFRTGDLVHVGAGGKLVPVGRVDGQVKIGGNRVEIAEVEDALRRVPGVRDAAVVPRTHAGGVTRLIGVCVVEDDLPPRRLLREHLRTRLPAHMVPSAFVAIERLPVLVGGKVDRQELAASLGRQGPTQVEPRNAAEETVAEIWHRVLGAERIGMDDDLFLDLGGDSLAAVQILTAVEEIFGRALPLGVFHEASTPAAFAARLADEQWEPPADGRLVVHAGGTCPPLFAVCGAFGHALRLLLIGRALDPEQTFVGLQPPQMDWASVDCRTIEAMAAHYLSTIRAMRSQGPYRLFGTSFGGLIVFEIALALQRAGEVVELLAMVDTAFPGDPSAARVDFTEGVDGRDRLVAMGLTVARQHRDALTGYVLRRRFDGEILYLRCADPPVPPALDPRRQWRRWATDGARFVSVPGRHGMFHREPQFGAVVRSLREALSALG